MLQVHIKPIKSVYYDTNSNFGIFACDITKDSEDSNKILFNTYGNFTLKGIMPKLEESKSYVATVKEVRDKKYGVGYEVVSIYEETPTTKEEQTNFLKVFLTEKQVDEIMKAYPNDNIIELIEENKFDYNIVKGIGEATYLKIKEKLLENKHMQKVFIVLQGEYGLTHNMIKKLINHYPSPQLLLEKIKTNPYILADEVDGVGFKKADLIAQKIGIEKNSYFRQDACLKYVLSENANKGHVYMYVDDAVKEMRELLGVKSNYIKEFIEELKIQEENEKNFYFTENSIALYRHYKNEKNIAYDVERLDASSYTIDIIGIDEKIASVEIEQNFDFTENQKEAILSVLTRNIVLINGKAGTGKTSIINGIVKILEHSKEQFTYNTIALSGKASQRIKESTGLESSTIHRFLINNPESFNTFKHNRDNPVDVDLLVIDEASMINANLFAKILEALNDGTKVVITGDYSQLEPIGAGNVFFDLCHSDKVKRIELKTVHRQAKRSGILTIANQFREGKSSFSKDDYTKRDFGELQDLHFFPYNDSESILKKVISISKAYKKQDLDILKFQVIVPLKKRGILCTAELNNLLQNIFNPLELGMQTVTRGKIEFREKDKVIHNGNNYNIGVLNGTVGIIHKIDNYQKLLLVNFETVGQREISFDDLKDIDLSYALTVHRTQGSQFENCVFALDYSSYIMLSRQLIYTAITRAIKHCYLICELEALLKAIKTDKSSNRNTYLLQLLSQLQ